MLSAATLVGPRRGFMLGTLFGLLLVSVGCTRSYFREKTDREAICLLNQKSEDPRWPLPGFFVYPDPRSRFADTTDPDHPPMPPDDPAAECLSPCPQKPGKAGVALVEGLGYLKLLETWDVQNRAEVAAREAAEKAKSETASEKDSSDENKKTTGEKKEKSDTSEKSNKKEKSDRSEKSGIEPTAYIEQEASKGEKSNGKMKSDKKESVAEEKEKDPKSSKSTEKAKGSGGSGGPGGGAALVDSPAKAQAEAEKLTRSELTDVVTATGPLPEDRVKAAISDEQAFLIKLEQAVELGLINSREYQTRREQLYLSALPVTVERFAFTPQLFAAGQVFRERFGRQSANGPVNRWRINSNAGLSQYFTTGGLLLLNFANQTIINLGNMGRNTSVSTLSLDFIQPLLRGAGRAVALEPLTQAERNLLYAVRDYVKFQQEFYVFIASGQPAFIPGQQAGVSAITSGTVTSPGRFIPPAVQLPIPLSGVGISPQITPGDGGQLFPINGAGATPQGFISAVGEKAQLINQYRNIQSLRRYLTLFRVYLEGGLVNQVQVGQVEQQLLNSTQNALNQQSNYRTSLDQFKQQLGLPMRVRIELDDEPLRPMLQQTRRYEDIIADYDVVYRNSLQYNRLSDVDLLRGRLRRMLTESDFVRSTRLSERVLSRLDDWAKVPRGPGGAAPEPIERRIAELVKERTTLREKRDRARESEQGNLGEDDLRRMQELDFEIEAGRLEQALRDYEKRIWLSEKDEARQLDRRNAVFLRAHRHFLGVLEDAFRERLDRVRSRWPALPSLCVDGVDLLSEDEDRVFAAVSRSALNNRLDLMNQRAQLVDSWRKIKVAANALLGVANVEYHVDFSSPPGRNIPFSLGGSRTQSQFIINTQLPLVRIQERNNYRATLIAYQQQRRQLQLAEDNLLFSIRLDLRQLRQAATNYHTVQKRSIELAYLQVDQALQAFSQPQAPPGPAAPPGSVGPPTTGGGTGDPAALTQQLLQTQNSLLQAQNGLYNAWISYLTTRMALYRDLGIMPLDPRGVWIDDIATCHCSPGTGQPTSPDDPQRPGQLPRPRELPGPDELPRPREEGGKPNSVPSAAADR